MRLPRVASCCHVWPVRTSPSECRSRGPHAATPPSPFPLGGSSSATDRTSAGTLDVALVFHVGSRPVHRWPQMLRIPAASRTALASRQPSISARTRPCSASLRSVVCQSCSVLGKVEPELLGCAGPCPSSSGRAADAFAVRSDTSCVVKVRDPKCLARCSTIWRSCSSNSVVPFRPRLP